MSIIAYQGIQGSFSHITAEKIFGKNHLFVGFENFHDVFDSLALEKATFGVIPIENSLIGSIHENYDLMHKFGTKICSEHYTGIHYSLLAMPIEGLSPEERLRRIRKAYSHSKALEQCADFFRDNPLIKPALYSDTAGAAAYVASSANPEDAAIASSTAGQIFGLQTLETEIEDDPMNYTRFFVISQETLSSATGDKCSLCIKLRNVPGALFSVLKTFVDYHLNLTKIESRPMPGTLFEYLFYIDFELNNISDPDLEEFFKKLEKDVLFFKNLGIYPKGSLWKS